MWGPSDAEWKAFIWTAVIVLLAVGATVGALTAWLLS